MIVYLDSSVIVRRLFSNQPLRASVKWGEWEDAFSCSLLSLEGLRTIDNARLHGKITDSTVAEKVQLLQEFLSTIHQIELTESILQRASMPFPTVIRTLDAIHVASACLWKEESRKEILFITHDIQQGIAAQAVGLHAEGFR